MVMTRHRWNTVLQWIVIFIIGCLILHTVAYHLSVTERFYQEPHMNHKKSHSRQQSMEAIKHLFAPPQTTDRSHTTYLLWSGGVASTFVLCDRILRFGETVRPIHLSIINMDTRKSGPQERETVFAMETYLKSEFPKQMKSKLLPIIEYVHIDSEDSNKEQKNPYPRTSAENVSKALGIIIKHPCINFYVKLAALACSLRRRKPYHKKSRLVVVLPINGPYQSLRQCVETWCTASHPQDPSRFTINTNTPMSNISTGTGDRKTFLALYKHIEWVLPDKSPEGLDMKRHALNHNPPFEHVLRKTWSCRNPIWTKEQNERRKLNPLSMITTMPIGRCNTCISCEQRMMDGLNRID